jgi:hypothetical protein
MKSIKLFFIVTALFFGVTLILLEVDRQCGFAYQYEDTISSKLVKIVGSKVIQNYWQ